MFKILLSSLLFVSCFAKAYVGSVTAATGEAGVATVEASENPYSNPAGLAFLTGYYFTAGFGTATQSAVGSHQDLAVSLIDNMKETVVPTSFSYAQTTTKPEIGSEALRRDFRLSFGNFIRPGFAFGLAIVHDNDVLEMTKYEQTNVQMGFLLAPNSDLGLAVLFENLVPPNKDIPEDYRLQQTTSVGASWNFKRLFRFRGDVIAGGDNSFQKPTLAFGMENYLNRWLVLRLGFQRNSEKEANLYTGGVGFIGPKFGLHYAYQNSPQKESLTRHSVDLAVPIW